VVKVTLIEICHRSQTDMWVGPHVNPLPGQEFHRAGLIEEDERPDHLAFRGRQCTAHLEPAQITGPWNDQRLDGVHADIIGAARLQCRIPAHARLRCLA